MSNEKQFEQSRQEKELEDIIISILQDHTKRPYNLPRLYTPEIPSPLRQSWTIKTISHRDQDYNVRRAPIQANKRKREEETDTDEDVKFIVNREGKRPRVCRVCRTQSPTTPNSKMRKPPPEQNQIIHKDKVSTKDEELKQLLAECRSIVTKNRDTVVPEDCNYKENMLSSQKQTKEKKVKPRRVLPWI